jgi:hypothetical protein
VSATHSTSTTNGLEFEKKTSNNKISVFTHRSGVTFPEKLTFLELQCDVTHKPIAIDYGLLRSGGKYQPVQENKEKSWPTNGSI